ncbi:efflux RND transporter periplasmic adaptor subunit [Pseudosulfitobacter sp. DSM 107133]|uniref:efflux RND transporter periplasmic adaptor subunit n=1 Tax=Pseudosulfitobacter sp. DSM 107133 TaxID=2883100 RepID=UPI000DF371EA|nr:efflux RND transporter periplasmic adaptor subunit [Pseudosulfitobacter sp. DSM 107133]UOA25775.1 Multidrug resistance protein MdtA [Pseudosulfitobacter sp. DSM 107133]
MTLRVFGGRQALQTLSFWAALTLAATGAVAEEPLAVEIVTTTRSAQTLTYSLTGEVVARDTLRASFPSGGRIAKLQAEEGDKVKQGAVLAQMDSVQQVQALRAAQAGLSTAQANHTQAIEDLDRQDALLERGATTRISRDSAEDALRITEGALTQANADLERAQRALDDTTLAAPTDATVIERLAEPGQVVGAAQPVLELALGSQIDAIFDMPEVLMSTPRLVDEIDLALIDRPNVHFSGTVREVSPLVDAGAGTVAVKITIEDTAPNITYGDAIRGTVTVTDQPRIAVPYTAMSATAAGPAVWVVNPDTMAVSLRPITVERYQTGWIILSGGLDENEEVVTRGAQLLYPGRIVRAAGDSQ